MTTVTIEDEELNRAIAASLQDMRPVPSAPEDVDEVEEKIEIPERIPVSNGLEKPSPPSANPPMPGMKLVTVIKNGWVTKEWRMF